MLLDFFCIFTTGGLIIFHKKFVTSKFETLINYLIKTILLDQKRNQESLLVSGTMLRWKISDEKKLVFVAGYQEAYSLLYIEKLILMVMNDFIKKEYDCINVNNGLVCEEYDYTKKFMTIINQWMTECEKAFEGGEKAKGVFKKEKEKEKEKNKSVDNKNNKIEKDVKQEDRVKSQGPETRLSGGNILNNNIPKNIQAKRGSKLNKEKESEKETEKPKGKEKTVWNDIDKYSHQNETKYDFSKQDSKETKDNKADKAKYIEEETNDDDIFDDNEFDLSDGESEKPEKKGGLFSKFTSSLKNFIGNKVLTEDDLKPVMKIFVDGLIDKNVARDIAEDLCESVKKSLLKSKTASFTTIKTTVQEALKEAISKILTPKQDLDVLKNALANKGRGEPYKVVFIGVNGVGKSTNLAKVAYLLKKNNLNLLIAACDNFRSGAIEQLKTHCRALEVDLFEKGYKDDIAYIAKEAIEEGKRKKKDVVLIDTAGRMQDNEPLMKSLAKLIEVNQPDLILFVGEALTGNDSVDQLTKFNQALIDYSKKDPPRIIDGILLTKFDTVDDKVGAALTMVYTTGKPIVYVGVGQKYTNLKKLNVNNVLNALFS